MTERQDAKSGRGQDKSNTRRPRPEPVAELDELAHRVIGAAISVHRALGPGFPEAVYGNALALEFNRQQIVCEREALLVARYLDQVVGEGRCDFIVGNDLVLELKATESLSAAHKAQVESYLRSANKHLGLLINFNVAVLKDGVRRMINPHYQP